MDNICVMCSFFFTSYFTAMHLVCPHWNKLSTYNKGFTKIKKVMSCIPQQSNDQKWLYHTLETSRKELQHVSPHQCATGLELSDATVPPSLIGYGFECREWGKRHCLSQSKGHDHKWSDSRSRAFAALLCCSPGRTFFTARANHSSFQSSLLKVKTLRVTAASQHTPSTKNGVITPNPVCEHTFHPPQNHPLVCLNIVLYTCLPPPSKGSKEECGGCKQYRIPICIYLFIWCVFEHDIRINGETHHFSAHCHEVLFDG